MFRSFDGAAERNFNSIDARLGWMSAFYGFGAQFQMANNGAMPINLDFSIRCTI